MGMFERDIEKEQVKNATGSYSRFEDIEGIGPKSANRIRNADYSIEVPKDVADFSAQELADKAGVSQKRARKAIKGGGGNPSFSNKSSGGSVSAAGIRMPVGEFKVEAGKKDSADAKFSDSLNRGVGRSQEAAQADKGKRAPVTTDLDEWKANKSTIDFPGVDTPREDPEFMKQDRRFNTPDDTTLDEKEGSLFIRENDIASTTDTTPSMEGVFPTSRSPGADTSHGAAEVAKEDVGAEIDEPSKGEAIADVTFLEREKEGFGEELIPFEAEESDKHSYDFTG